MAGRGRAARGSVVLGGILLGAALWYGAGLPLSSGSPPWEALTAFLRTWTAAEEFGGEAPAGLDPQRFDAAALRRRLDASGRAPIFFLPPLGGVQLEMRLRNKPSVPHCWCAANSGWRLAWLSWRMLLPWNFDCFLDAFRVECDSTTGRHCHSPLGVSVRPRPGFDSGMCVLPGGGRTFKTFAGLADTLQELGWEPDVTMHAHLYDWRLSPFQWVKPGGSLERLQRQIEDAVEAAGGRPAICISLSMGAPYFALFLREGASPEWQRRYLAGHIAVAPAWGGSLYSPLGLLWGWTGERSDGVQRAREALLRFARGLPVLSWLAPAPGVFGATALASAPGRNYTAADVGDWLREGGAMQAAAVWEASRPYMERRGGPPSIPTYCFYSLGVPTAVHAAFTDPAAGSGAQPQVQYGDGDGTVPAASLLVCDGWRRSGTPPAAGNATAGAATATAAVPPAAAAATPAAGAAAEVHVKRYSGVQHGQMLYNQAAFTDVLAAVLDLSLPSSLAAAS